MTRPMQRFQTTNLRRETRRTTTPILTVTSTNDWIDTHPLRHKYRHPSLVVFHGTAHLGCRRLSFDADDPAVSLSRDGIHTKWLLADPTEDLSILQPLHTLTN